MHGKQYHRISSEFLNLFISLDLFYFGHLSFSLSHRYRSSSTHIRIPNRLVDIVAQPHAHAHTRTHSTFILKQILGWWTVGHRFSHCFPIEVKESIALVPNIYQCVHNFFPLQCGMAHDLQPKTFIFEVFPCYELRVLTTHCRVHSVAAMVLCACVWGCFGLVNNKLCSMILVFTSWTQMFMQLLWHASFL